MPGWWTNARQAEAYNFLVNNGGLSPYGAAGLVSRWANVESTAGGPNAVNPYSKAFGIAQWLGSRLPPIKGNTNFQAQLAYVVRELNSTESKAGNVLRQATSPQEGARGASMYERAEGYNANTGIDNWTAKTGAGIPGMLAIVGGGGAPPPTIAGPTILPGQPRPAPVGNGDTGGVSTVDLNQASMFSGSGLLLLGGALALYFFLSRN